MKKILNKLGLFALVLLLAGCQSQTTSSQTNTQTIEHVKGSVEVATDIKKVAIFDFGFLDTIDTLDVEVELAVPVDSLPGYLDKYKEVTNAGGIKEPDMEALYTFAPDVIVISGRQADYYDELSKIAPTVYVEINAATYMEDMTKNTHIAATLFDKETEAKEALENIQNQIQQAVEKTKTIEEKALIVLTNDGNISAYGAGSRFGLIHDTLGVKQIDEAIETSTHGQSVNYEYLSKVNPDILYVVDRSQVVGGSVDSNSTLDNELVNQTNAAKNNKIINLSPDYWYLSTGGLTSVSEMIKEAISVFN